MTVGRNETVTVAAGTFSVAPVSWLERHTDGTLVRGTSLGPGQCAPLVRGTHPDSFLELAEESCVMQPLGRDKPS